MCNVGVMQKIGVMEIQNKAFALHIEPLHQPYTLHI